MLCFVSGFVLIFNFDIFVMTFDWVFLFVYLFGLLLVTLFSIFRIIYFVIRKIRKT